jgi:hypothetical protein
MAYIEQPGALPPIGGERYGIPAGMPVHYEVLPTTARRPRQQIGGITHTTLTSGRVNLARVTAPTGKRRSRSADVHELKGQMLTAIDKLLGQ